MTVKEENEVKKEYLKSYRSVCNRITVLEHRIEELRAAQEQAKIQQITDMPKGHKQTDLSDYIVKLEHLQEQTQAECIKKHMTKLDIEENIMRVNNEPLSNLLYKRYILLQDWDTISIDLDCSKRNIYRMHGEALHTFDCPKS